MKLKVDQDKCIGCGTCPMLAPSSFKMNDEDGKAVEITPHGDDDTALQAALESCPVGAIEKVEE
jgi:ferredoxin